MVVGIWLCIIAGCCLIVYSDGFVCLLLIVVYLFGLYNPFGLLTWVLFICSAVVLLFGYWCVGCCSCLVCWVDWLCACNVWMDFIGCLFVTFELVVLDSLLGCLWWLFVRCCLLFRLYYVCLVYLMYCCLWFYLI